MMLPNEERMKHQRTIEKKCDSATTEELISLYEHLLMPRYSECEHAWLIVESELVDRGRIDAILPSQRSKYDPKNRVPIPGRTVRASMFPKGGSPA